MVHELLFGSCKRGERRRGTRKFLFLVKMITRASWTWEARNSNAYFFFETNQAGELPIILKRRNNIQTGQNNNDKETDQLDLDTATPTPLELYSTNNRLDWDINAAAPLHLTRLETTINNKDRKVAPKTNQEAK